MARGWGTIQFALIILKIIEKEVMPHPANQGTHNDIIMSATQMILALPSIPGPEVIRERWGASRLAVKVGNLTAAVSSPIGGLNATDVNICHLLKRF